MNYISRFPVAEAPSRQARFLCRSLNHHWLRYEFLIAESNSAAMRRAICRDLNFQKWGIRFVFPELCDFFLMEYPTMTCWSYKWL